MSLIKNIRDELAAISTGIGSALDTAAEAAQAGGDIEERAAAAGFTGIAEGMSQVRDAIQEIRAQLSSAADSLGEAQTPLDQAPEQTTPEQAINVLAPVVQSLTGVFTTVGAVLGTVEDTQRLVAAVLDGGEPGPMLSRLDTIQQECEQVISRCDAAKQHVETAVQAAARIGDEG